MRSQILILIGCTICVMGCAEKAQEAPAKVDEAVATTPAAESPDPETEALLDDAFLRHMHRHAEMLDEIGFALADGDLEGASTPAYWLSTHDEIDGLRPEWQPYLVSMRSAARTVEKATDEETARAAAEQITAECQGCHAAAGIMAD